MATEIARRSSKGAPDVLRPATLYVVDLRLTDTPAFCALRSALTAEAWSVLAHLNRGNLSFLVAALTWSAPHRFAHVGEQDVVRALIEFWREVGGDQGAPCPRFGVAAELEGQLIERLAEANRAARAQRQRNLH